MQNNVDTAPNTVRYEPGLEQEGIRAEAVQSHVRNPFPDMTPSPSLTRLFQNSLVWSSTSAGLLGVQNFPSTNFGPTLVATSLSYCRYLAYKPVCTVSLNSSSLNFGALYVAYVPAAGYADMDLARLMQYPGFIMDASSDKTSSYPVEIPWTLPCPWLDLNQYSGAIDYDCLGTLYIAVIAPLQNTTGTACALTVNIEFSMQNPQTAGLQIARSINASNSLTARNWLGNAWHPGIISSMKRIAPSTSEADKKVKGGVVSSTLESLHGLASSLSSVPVLSGPANIAGGIFSIGAQIAKSLGFSKPLTTEVTSRTTHSMMSDLITSSGLDNSTSFSYRNSAYVTENPASLPFKRATSFKDICSSPSIIFSGAFSNTDPVGQLSLQLPATPSIPLIYGNNGTSSNVSTTNIGFVADFFQLWRGSIVFDITIFASPFHSGEIALVYQPNQPTANTTSFGYLTSDFLTIRGTTKFKFSVPYLAECDWLSTQVNYGNLPTGIRCASGWLAIYVKKPVCLQGNIATATSVNYIVEISSPDIQFTCAKAPSPISSPIGSNFKSPSFTTPLAQGRTFDPSFSNDDEAEDKVEDFAQMYHRYSRMNGSYTPPPSAPGSVVPIWNDGAITSVSDHSYLASKFHLWRGSVNYKLTQSYLAAPVNTSICTTFTPNGFIVSGALTSQTMGGVVRTNTAYSPAVEYSVPYYAQNPCDSVRLYPTGSYLNTYLTPSKVWAVSNPNGALDVYVAFGDDFGLYLMACSPRFSVIGVF